MRKLNPACNITPLISLVQHTYNVFIASNFDLDNPIRSFNLQRTKRKSRCLKRPFPMYLCIYVSMYLAMYLCIYHLDFYCFLHHGGKFSSITTHANLNAYNFCLRQNSAELIRTFIGQFFKSNSMGPIKIHNGGN